MELLITLVILGLIIGHFIPNDKSTRDIEKRSNNYYTQNNIYIQNNYGTKAEAHTKRVWKRLGYEVRYGERYAYKYYGNEIYMEDQVM